MRLAIKKIVWILAFLSHMCLNSFSQKLQPYYKHFGPEQGVPSTEIYQTYIDTKGFIWLATNKGISRYDGYEFKNFDLKEGLPDNTILYIAGEDKKGTVWFSSMNMDLFGIQTNFKVIIAPNQKKIKEIFNSGANILPSVGNDDNLYINLITGYSCLKIEKNGNLNFLKRPTKKGELVITQQASRFSVQQFGDSSGHVNPYSSLVVNDKNRKLIFNNFKTWHTHIQSKYLFQQNQLFEFSQNNLYKINLNNGKIDSLLFSSNINDIYVDSHFNLIVSTYMDGLFIFENSNLKSTPKNLLEKQCIGRISEDKLGGYWIPTLNNGLYYIPNLLNMAYVFRDEDQFYSVEKIASDNSTVIFCVSNGKLYKLNNKQQLIELKCFLKNDKRKLNFSSVVFDKPQNQFIVSSNLSEPIFIKDDKLFTIKGSNCVSLFRINHYNKTYISTWNQIWEIDNKTQKTIPSSIEKLRIRADKMFSLNRDTILLGGPSGLSILLPNQNKLISPSSIDSIYADRVKEIVDYENYLIIGCKTKGIIIAKKNDLTKYSCVNKTNYLPSERVNCIMVKNKSIWIGTDRGVAIYGSIDELLKKEKPLIISSDNGLVSNDIQGIVFVNDTVYIASVRGLNIITKQLLKDIKSFDHNSKIEISEFVCDSNIYNSSEKIILPAGSKNLTIKFSSLNWKNSTNNLFKYKLVNKDNNWNYTKENKLKFENLNPGNYELVLAASADNGITWGKIKTISFSIEYFFYQTIWFFILTISVCIYIIYFVTKTIILKRKLKELKQARALVYINQIELKALRAQMNPHFIFNVISSIQHYILDNEPKAAYKYLSTFAKLIRNVLNNSEKKDITLHDEITWLKQYVELEQMRFNQKFKFELNINEDIDLKQVKIPSMILQPIIENAIKHGISHDLSIGIIQLAIYCENDSLYLSVTDNGPGYGKNKIQDNENEHKSMATSILNERIHAYNELYGYDKIIVTISDNQSPQKDKPGTKVVLQLKNSM